MHDFTTSFLKISRAGVLPGRAPSPPASSPVPAHSF